MGYGGLRRFIEFRYDSATLTMKRHITCLHFEDDTSKADLTASGASNLARAACGNDFRGRPK